MRPDLGLEKWARPKPGAHGLRRGAWYAVVNEMGTAMIVLDVQKNNVPVPRDMLVLSEHPPMKWTVVQWQESQRGAERASQENDGLTYAVCPICQTRTNLTSPDAPQLMCMVCEGAYDVNWQILA